jgi:hypothetical protein
VWRDRFIRDDDRAAIEAIFPSTRFDGSPRQRCPRGHSPPPAVALRARLALARLNHNPSPIVEVAVALGEADEVAVALADADAVGLAIPPPEGARVPLSLILALPLES